MVNFYGELKKGFTGDNNVTTIPTSQNTWEKCEVIHLGFVCSGFKSNLYLHTMLKSLLFHRHNPLHLHIVVNKFSENVLRTLFDTWRIPKLNVSYYEMNPLLPDVRWVPNSHYSGLYGLLKLTFDKFIPKEVDKIIVLDTDLTFISDINDLWQLFSEFGYNQAIGLVENESDFYLSSKRTVWPAIGKGFNTGVILYRLDKLRLIAWDKLWNRVAKKAAMLYGATSLGDQDIMNTVLKQYPNLLHEVPCYWNTQLSDHTTSHQCYSSNQIKIIHWNSPKKIKVINKDGVYFRSLYTTFLEMDGYLVTTSLYDCANDSTPAETPTDVCFQFKQAKGNKWRTLLFFRNFEYIPVSNDVTFVAQLSYDRLQMVEQLSKQWEGPISLTLYVTDPEFQQALHYIDNSEVLQERTNIAYHAVFKKGDYHPINLLRNVGLKNVNTPYVFLADIDFLPMFGLHQTLRNAIASLKVMNKKALIVPAFESQRYRSRFPKNKHELLQMLENKAIFTFRYDVWASGHAPTNYSRWKTAQSPYTIKWEPDFEPYIVVKKNVVEYDASFIGFGWNKVSHIMELECQNYEFIVLHNAFIVHKPHSPSYDIIKFRKDPIYRMCLQNLKEEFVEGLQTKYGRMFEKSNRHEFEPPSEE
ncbi:xylosyl- and glucuronyltransferase LARGE2s-like [Atheta coriaria]|uniref:xylosyl- and glucuronyltransferase LARGE2s-like n=1 Tax=Dalotia coriaria TaxID=877792 RepID=UPI0031F44E3C